MSDTFIITEDLINMDVLSADIHVDLLYVRDTYMYNVHGVSIYIVPNMP